MSDESNKSTEPDNAQASATATVRECPFCGNLPEVNGKVLRHINRRCIAGNMEMHFHSYDEAVRNWNDQFIRYHLEEKEKNWLCAEEALVKLRAGINQYIADIENDTALFSAWEDVDIKQVLLDLHKIVNDKRP